MDHFPLESQGFLNLLASQGSKPLEIDSQETARLSSQSVNDQTSKPRRSWSLNEDLVVISAWLNTSKDPIVANEQKGGTFWKRITEYFNASPVVVATGPRELSQIKQRWGRINDHVCKFVGSYESAVKEQRSGQNNDDVLKAAHEIFYNDYGFKFNLDHGWRKLRLDQKWSSYFHGKEGGKEKRKIVSLDGTHEEIVVEEVSETRPPGVKAAKAAKRKKCAKTDEMEHMKNMLELKEKLNKQKLLDRLLAKPEPLSEIESSLRNKLIEEML